MKILWIVNTIFPDISVEIGIQPPVYGGWMYGLAERVANAENIDLSIATVYDGDELIHKKIKKIDYYLVPKKNKQIWANVYDLNKPDVIHIHGSEYPHGLDLINLRPEGKYILSIQGLISECAKYYLAGMSTTDVIKNITLRDILRFDNLFQSRNKFYKRGLVELEYFKKVNAVIGRTDWDKAHAWALNPNLKYYFCNESLRPEFYMGEEWSYEKCQKNSIFLSQANYPLKGLHQVLKAASVLKKEFSDLKIYVAGNKICGDGSFKSKLKISGYGRYIRSLIEEFDLENNIEFLGTLSAEQMKQQYLKANVFVCPSSLENSPNSVCEAQILGVPVVASFVGGISNFLNSGDMFEFNDITMLADKIKTRFNNKHENCINNSKNIHNVDLNTMALIGIYNGIRGVK